MTLKNLIYCLLFSTGFMSCTESAYMRIEGQIPDKYDGCVIYLVPQPNPVAEEVDSAIIQNGKFRFRVQADSVCMYDLTVSRLAKANVQKLLLVTEPGILYATIDTVSSATGTPLNNQLQTWKDQLGNTGDEVWKLQKSITEQKITDEHMLATIRMAQDSILEAFGDSTCAFISRNPNAMGHFIHRMMHARLNEKQQIQLNEKGFTVP